MPNAHNTVLSAAVETVTRQLGDNITVTPQNAPARVIRAQVVHPSDVMEAGLRVEAFGGLPGLWAAHSDVADLTRGDRVTIDGNEYEIQDNLMIGGWRQLTGVKLTAVRPDGAYGAILYDGGALTQPDGGYITVEHPQ